MSNATISLLDDITTIYSAYSNFFILIIGLFSNISLIFIFITLYTFRHNQCTFYLTVESAANIVLLFLDTSSPIYNTIFGFDPIDFSLVWCKIQKAVSQQAGLFSLFTICCLTFDQYLATNPRSNWRQMSTLKLAHRLTYCNLLFNIAHGILFIIFTDISPSVGCTPYNSVLSLYFSVFYFSILSTGIPLVVMVTFSLLAYRNVRRIIRRQITVVRRRLDRQLTAMVLARVISLIVLGIPFIVSALYRSNISNAVVSGLSAAIAGLLVAIAISCLDLNFAMNLYLFFVISSRFRRRVKYFFLKKCWDYLNCSCESSSRNQVRTEIVHGAISELESV